MKSYIRAIANPIIICCTAACVVGCARLLPTGGQPEPYGFARSRLRLIPAQTVQPSLRFNEKEIYGSYYMGDGLGQNCTLTLNADHRFHFVWRGCLGLYDENEGPWRVNGDMVVCSPTRKNRCEGLEGMNTRYVPVKWGSRYYLVDENEMPGFCAACAPHNRLASFNMDDRHGVDYVKLIDNKLRPVSGDPTLPARFHTYFEHGAVTAKVVKVNANGGVTLDKGSQDRLAPGMLLCASSAANIEIKIQLALDHNAKAMAQYVWNSERAVKVGETFTTGEYWNRPRGTGFQLLNAPPLKQANRR